jgi:ribosomal protein L29
MNAQELKLKPPEELRRMARELRAELRDLRFKVATRQASTVRKSRELRKDLARILTQLSSTTS